MSSFLSHLIYGGGGNDQNGEENEDALTDAQPLFSLPPPDPNASEKTSPYLGGLVYEDNEGDNGSNNDGHVLAQYSQQSENSPQRLRLFQDSQSPHSQPSARSPLILSQQSVASHTSNASQRSNRSDTSRTSAPIRNRGMSYQSQVYYDENPSPAANSPQEDQQMLSQGDSYLSQMIYGHPGHYGEDEDDDDAHHQAATNPQLALREEGLAEQQPPANTAEPNKKRKWEEVQLEDDKLLEEENVNEIASSVLNALFSKTGVVTAHPETQATTPTKKPPTFANPFLESLQKQVITEDLDEDDEDLTEEDREERVKKELKQLKFERHYEWRAFRDRWKRRKIDLREEEDVGNAYLRRARVVLEPKLVLEKELQKAQEESQKVQEDIRKEQEADHKLVNYDSEDEQMDVLQQLSQTVDRQEAEAKQKIDPVFLRRKRQQEELESLKVSFAANMDYWQQGKSDPAAQDLEFHYPRDIPVDETKVSLTSRKRRRGSAPSQAIELKGRVNQPEPDLNTYFHFPLHRRQYASARVIHHRQLIRVAARCIVSATASGQHDDRLLRALWQPDHEKFRRFHFLLAQTQEYGQNMATFLDNVWKNDRARKLVAKRLGILKQNEFDPPPRLMGFTMEPAQVQTACNYERRRLVERYSLARMPSISADGESESATRSKRRRLVPPTVGYIHLPGAAPPIPTFPLGETNLVFGPSDRHICFRHVGGIDEATYKLTFSSLVTRIATLQKKEQAITEASGNLDEYPPDPDQEQDLSAELRWLQEQLFTFVDQAPLAAKHNLFKRFQAIDPRAEIPLVQFFRAMMAFCSFVVSGCPQPKVHKSEASQSGNHVDQLDMEDGESPEAVDVSVLTMDEAARKICDFCEPHIKHNGLRAFPRIHLVYGLATIARILPSSAAEILSAPMDNMGNRTPLDTFRRTLDHLEAESFLIEQDQATAWMDDDESVRVGELEYALHRAVEMFGMCIQRDPIEVRYHEWRLGALGASLLLCSGHLPGRRALPFPSSHYMNQDAVNAIYGLSRSDFRKTLDKFDEVRRATIEALQLLMQLTQHQKTSSRGHLAVSSFLEWKQVVALVAGRSCFKSTRLKEICSSHMYHSVHWATQERSTSALKYLEIVSRSNGESSDLRLKQLAAAVELDPNNIENWRSLVVALGPLGFDDNGGLSCALDGCKECQMLREGFVRDHVSLEARKSSREWWGRDIVGWWGPHYLTTTLQVPQKSKTLQLMKKLVVTVRVGFIETDESFEPQPHLHNSTLSSHGHSDTGWLDNGDPAGNYQQGDDDQEARVETLLPKRFAEVMNAESRTNSCEPAADLSPELEAVYVKVVVICHLFGITHPSALEIIYELCRRCVKGETKKVDLSCGEWHCLLALSRLGLDILQIIRHYQSTTLGEEERPKPKKATKPRFSEAQREAVRDGLERFGHGKWVAMSRHYEVLHGLSRFVILDIYKWLLKYEGMKNIAAAARSETEQGIGVCVSEDSSQSQED